VRGFSFWPMLGEGGGTEISSCMAHTRGDEPTYGDDEVGAGHRVDGEAPEVHESTHVGQSQDHAHQHLVRQRYPELGKLF
jgi:hypothetical protein